MPGKKVLSIILAAAFVISAGLMPALQTKAYASSSNKITILPYVDKDANLFKLEKTPILEIVNSSGDWEKKESFTLKLSGKAEWNKTIDSGGYEEVKIFEAKHNNIYPRIGATERFSVESYKASASTLEVNCNFRGTPDKGLKIFIPMNVTLNGDRNEMTVKIKSDSGNISDDTLTYAYVQGAPVTVEVEKLDIQGGVKDQTAGTIRIIENRAGAIAGSSEFGTFFWIRIPSSENGIKFTEADIKLIGGNLDLDEEKNGISDNGKSIYIYTNKDSSKPSEIRVSVKVDAGANATMGQLYLEIGGASLKSSLKKSYDLKDDYYRTTYGFVIPPTTTYLKYDVKFAPGIPTYWVASSSAWSEIDMDTAPFIIGSRLYIPIRYVSEAFKIGSMSWLASEQAVMLSTPDKTIKLKAGSNTMIVNSDAVNMEAPPLMVNGRMFLPISQLSYALGLETSWDPATNTATFSMKQ